MFVIARRPGSCKGEDPVIRKVTSCPKGERRQRAWASHADFIV